MAILNDSASVAATRMAAAASLAGGIIASAGRPFSMEEARKVFDDAYWTLFPDKAVGRYIDWLSEHDPKKRYDASWN